MKRLLGLLLVMGMVGCGGGEGDAPPSGDDTSRSTAESSEAALVDRSPVEESKLVERGFPSRAYVGDSKTPFTGVAVDKYANEKKKSEATYKDGKKEGLQTEWYDSGQKRWEVTFNKYGKHDGPGTSWHENGQMMAKKTYKNGKPEGLVTEWHENGQKSSEVTYKDGKEEGLMTRWHENGQKAEEMTFKDGEPEGLSTMWHENGQKQHEATYKYGELVSVTRWDEEGNEIK